MTESQSQLTSQALAAWTDQELITEWSETAWESGDPQLDIMAAEIARRGLDF